jgi:single-strand selective monofunctional uracil DNA glycosylase
MEESGRNVTPDKLTTAERGALLPLCDEHLRTVVRLLEPEWIVGVGKFAEARAITALGEMKDLKFASIPHPSPASPAANKNWGAQALAALDAAGVPRDR